MCHRLATRVSRVTHSHQTPGEMLGQWRRLWANISPSLGQGVLFAGLAAMGDITDSKNLIIIDVICCRCGKIREVLIFGRINSRIQLSRENCYYNSATKEI